MSSTSKLISLTSAAELLGVHSNTLRDWDNKGILNAVRIGPKLIRKYTEDDLISFIRKSRAPKKVHVTEGPIIAVAVMVLNSKNQVIWGKRKATRGYGEYAFPGGYLAFGETFEQSALNEVLEETGLRVQNPKVFCITNNLKNLHQENKQSVTVGVSTEYTTGTPRAMEPENCESWSWYPINHPPKPLFEADGKILDCYRKGTFYVR